MEKVKYSIEYAHIYADEQFSPEHRAATEELSRVLGAFHPRNDTYALAVLIDDYNPAQHTLKQDEFIGHLTALGARPDYIGLEAKLVAYKDHLVNAITKPKVRREYQRYLDRRPKLPCSFLVAIWYLIRLDAISSTDSAVYRKVGSTSVAFGAHRLINILPHYFRAVEDQAMSLIRATSYRDRADDISARFYQSNFVPQYANIS